MTKAYICKTSEREKREQWQIHLGLLDFFELSGVSNGSICTNKQQSLRQSRVNNFIAQGADKINQLEIFTSSASGETKNRAKGKTQKN
jgi:hypothetical protein